MKPNELYHYGVLGMRWGVRRNRDNIITRTSSRRTRGLKYRLKQDEKRASKGRPKQYDTKKLKSDLKASQKYDKMVQDRVTSLSKGKLAAQTLLFGSRGALRYNQIRTSGYDRLVSAGAAVVSNLMRPFPISVPVNAAASIATSVKYAKKKGR